MLIDLIMKINVGDNQTIKEIQTNFSERYPYLKIEFFTKPHEKFRGSSKESMVDSNTLIKNCRSVHGEGEIEIFPSTKVSTLENKFREVFGLHVQVFRKSGNVWIETTVTDDWTLEKQNNEAESFIKDIQGHEESYFN